MCARRARLALIFIVSGYVVVDIRALRWMMTMNCPNTLYFGDNLHVLREHVRDESVDLIYLDPPFKSDATYNVLFRAPNGDESDAQAHAFVDTWHWGEEAESAYGDIVGGGTGATEIVIALRRMLGESDLMAYLAMMAVRLIEMRRVLKPTGSLYLHCDPSASHYLKIILDGIFGQSNFKNEIIWKMTSAHGGAKRFGSVHDVILFYAMSDNYTWNRSFQPYDKSYVDAFYIHVDPDGRRWRRSDMTGAGTRNGETGLAWRGIDVTAKGRHWAWIPSEMEKMDAEGRIHWPAKKGGMPMLKRYLDEQPGVPTQDIIDDIPPMHNLAADRLGYPTQKPTLLLERIVGASSDVGDVVLDPFCGCGTAVHAAQKLGRSWIGIDITHIAIQIIENRLHRYFPMAEFTVEGRPVDLAGARELAARDKYQFQWWASSLIGAQPRGGHKKGGDRGVDGIVYFKTSATENGRGVVSVKGGRNIGPSMIRDLIGTRVRESADLAVFITLEEPTPEMERTAAADGFLQVGFDRVPRCQILTIAGLLDGRGIRLPTYDIVSARESAMGGNAGRAPRKPRPEQREFLFPHDGGALGTGAGLSDVPDGLIDPPIDAAVRKRRKASG